MSKILVMTDIHLTEPPETIIGLDPGARLSEGLAHAALHHPDADRLILTGDLAHHGRAAQYARLAELLSDLPWPVTLMIGNHDRRDAFRTAFPDADIDADGHVQCIIDLADIRLICLDTVDEDAEVQHSGRLCPARMAWLQNALDTAPDHGAIVFMHHPPIETGFIGMDKIGLSNLGEVRGLLAGHPKLRHILAGHVHRSISASMAGVPVSLLKSTCHQMPMCLGETDHDLSVDEPAAYGILLAGPADVIIHSTDYTLPASEIRTS
jgi:3',5'-cyclic-AMP phosphodiesterase